MAFRTKRTRILVAPSFYIFVCFFLLLLPVKWFFAWLLASFIHELFHYAAIRLCECEIYTVDIKASGVTIDTFFDKWYQECLCAISGPLGSLLVASCIGKYPVFGFWGLIQFGYNLLPIFPSDGGRVLQCLVMTHLPQRIASIILAAAEWASILLLIFVVISISIHFKAGAYSFLFVMIFCLRHGKRPCKQSEKRVQ